MRRGEEVVPTHGSLSKAGKFKQLEAHQRQWRIDPKTGQPSKSKQRKKGKKGAMKGGSYRHGKKSYIPRVKNRLKYNIATMCPACSNDKNGRANIRIGVSSCWRCRARLEWKGNTPKAKENQARIE